MEMSSQLHDAGAQLPTPLDRRMDGHQRQSGHCGEQKNIFPISCWKVAIFFTLSTSWPVTILTELSRLRFAGRYAAKLW
jgi:hypothetical protein